MSAKTSVDESSDAELISLFSLAVKTVVESLLIKTFDKVLVNRN